MTNVDSMSEPTDRPAMPRQDVKGSLGIDWMYPNIYADKPLDRIEIALYSVRAACDITIEFDGARNGWVVRMDRTRDGDGCMEVVEAACEVAFVPAWNEEDDDA